MISFAFLTAALALFAPLPAAAAPPTVAAAATSGLAGAWEVDLSATPEQPYTKEMVLTLAEDGSVTGSFYDSTIETGRWRLDRGRTCASFRTSDGAGPYHSAVCLDDSGLRALGQTWAEHRDFLFNWNASRKASGE